MKGSYVLVVELDREKDILIGRLGYIYFPRGFYAYTGSAMNGLEVRLARHLRKEKRLHWHIDYLLNEAEVSQVILCAVEPFAPRRSEGAKRPKNPAHGRLRAECFLAQTLTKEFPSIPGFGVSDCKCRSHLYFGSRKELKAKVIGTAGQAGVVYETFPRGELTKWHDLMIPLGN